MSLRFYEIGERHHRIQNPFNEQKLMLLGERCNLTPGTRQLDLACGQGELLCRWARQWGIAGVGVDISSVFIDIARQRAGELAVTERLEFVQGDAAEYRQAANAFDVVSCIGATWIGGGTLGTLALMRRALKDESRGLLLIGEVFWKQPPTDEVREALGFEPGYVASIGGLLDRFDEAGVELLEMIPANQEDWDRYESKRWRTIHDYLRSHPDDPEADALRAWNEAAKRDYLVYERPYLGWSVFMLRPKA